MPHAGNAMVSQCEACITEEYIIEVGPLFGTYELSGNFVRLFVTLTA